MACIEFPILIVGVGILSLLIFSTGAAFILGPIVGMAWFLWTNQRRARLRAQLLQRQWPPILLLPDLLQFPDPIWNRLPTFESVAVIPKFGSPQHPRLLLWKTLQALEHHMQCIQETPGQFSARYSSRSQLIYPEPPKDPS